MSKGMTLNIITPDRGTITEEISSLITDQVDGKIEFLANHAPSIVATVPTVSIFQTTSGSTNKLFTSSGIVYVKKNVINFCCDTINYAEEVDMERAQQSLKRAKDRLAKKENIDIERALRAIARANARLSMK